MKGRVILVIVLGSTLLPFGRAAQTSEDDDPDAAKKSLPELVVVLPALPTTQSLLEFQPSAASSNRYFVDAQSITVEKDGTVRYTLVVRGGGGAENISYEGMRCETVEYKAYAFGRRDGTWSSARASTWRKIEYKVFNAQYGVLYADYFCPDGKTIRSPRDAVARFKYGVPYGAPPRTAN